MTANLWAVVVLSAVIVLLQHPRVSIVTLGGAGLLAYSVPALVGLTLIPETAELTAVTQTAVAYMVLMWSAFGVTVWAGSFLYSPAGKPADGQALGDGSFLVAAAAVFVALVAIIVVQLGPGVLLIGRYRFADAMGASQVLGLSWVIGKWAAALGLVFACQSRRWPVAAAFVTALVFVGLLGDRTTPVIALAAALLVMLRNLPIMTALRRPLVWVGAVVVTAAVFLIKPAYKALSAGVDIFTVLAAERPVAIMAQWEAFGTHAVLERIVATGFSFDWTSTLTASLGQLLVVPSAFGISSSQFNDTYQPLMFPDVTYGLAGNYLAQWFAMFGLVGCIVAGALYAAVLMLIDRWHQKAPGSVASFAILIGSAFAVYQHRNSVENELAIMRQVAIAFIGIWCLALAVEHLKGAFARRTEARL